MKRLGYIYMSFLILTLAVVFAIPFDGPDLGQQARERIAAGDTELRTTSVELVSAETGSVIRPRPAPIRPVLSILKPGPEIAKDDPIFAEVAPLDIEQILKVSDAKFPDQNASIRPRQRPVAAIASANVAKPGDADLAAAVIAALNSQVDGLNADTQTFPKPAAGDGEFKDIGVSDVQLTSAPLDDEVPLDTLAPKRDASVYAVATAIRPQPRGVGRSVGAAAPKVAAVVEQKYITYVVQPGDTMFSISRAFFGDNSKTRQIYQANRDKLANPTAIKIGQSLKIPQF